jgi:hypothetical protein
MSLCYQLVFPRNAPNARFLLRQQVAAWGESFHLQEAASNQLLVLRQQELVATVVVTHESNYFELSFGEYRYTTDWYIELGKTVGLTAMQFYKELLGKVITTYAGDFLSLFNGELVIAKRADNQVYLNTGSSLWQDTANLSLLGNQAYELATYPVD